MVFQAPLAQPALPAGSLLAALLKSLGYKMPTPVPSLGLVWPGQPARLCLSFLDSSIIRHSVILQASFTQPLGPSLLPLAPLQQQLAPGVERLPCRHLLLFSFLVRSTVHRIGVTDVSWDCMESCARFILLSFGSDLKREDRCNSLPSSI